MKKELLGQEPAFPREKQKFDNQVGISKRYLTAKDILCSVLSNQHTVKAIADSSKDGDEFVTNAVKYSYNITDELLKQEYENDI